MLNFLVGLFGLLVIVVALWDAFETIILPRRVIHKLRLTRFFNQITWRPWRAWSLHLRGSSRESFLGYYGPLSLIVLLIFWAVMLILGFAFLQWSLGSHLAGPAANSNLGTDIYMSGVTFFTLGFGDVTPATRLAKFISVVEVGLGFGFLAAVISYLPVVYQSFSLREVNVSMLDERAGSPPSAVELLRRHAQPDNIDAVKQFFKDWERWCAELMESHLSYPLLAYFRSQHENQSWLAALTMVLDFTSLVICSMEGPVVRQANLTFAMARHAAVDLSQVFHTPPAPATQQDRNARPRPGNVKDAIEDLRCGVEGRRAC